MTYTCVCSPEERASAGGICPCAARGLKASEPACEDWRIVRNDSDDDGCDIVDRLRVDGGWIYRNVLSRGVGLCFVPDAKEVR